MDYLTTEELAAIVRTPAETIRYWRSIKKGPKSFKIGRRVLYERAEVERFLAEAQAKAE